LQTDVEGLAQKIMGKTDDPVARRIHRGNAERMHIASFISALADKVGKHVLYQSPRNLEQALQITLAVQEAGNRSLMRVFILGLINRSH
jgi:hypothetical protein